MPENEPQDNFCPQCSKPLPPGSPRGLCPACLLKCGLEANTVGFTEEDRPRARWTPPTVEQLAPLFPELDILELIGRGGMGAVYKAREKQLDRLVALKILPPEIGREEAFAQRFAREAQAMARLSHPNIVTIHSFGRRPAAESATAGNLYFFIMEYVDGLSLRQLLDRGTIDPKEALAIVPQICDALQFAHDRGIVHRDIKPENILLSREGQVKIADFGLAKLVGLGAGSAAEGGTATPAAPGVTQVGEKVVGTPHYMAPEQVDRPKDVDHRADIYSLGVVFYQMLTGELPKGTFEPPSHKVLIDVRLDEVVLRALEHEPSRRYQQVSQIRTEVETIVETSADRRSPVPSAAAATAPAAPPRFSRKAIIGAIWAAFFFAIIPVGVVLRLGRVDSVMISFLALPILLPGLTAPFGTTILGAIALAQIRRSAGRLCGLGLALFDTMLFPLLIFDGLICEVCSWSGLNLAASVIVALAIDAVIVWLAWRAASKGTPSGAAPQAAGGKGRVRRVAAYAAAGLLALASGAAGHALGLAVTEGGRELVWGHRFEQAHLAFVHALWPAIVGALGGGLLCVHLVRCARLSRAAAWAIGAASIVFLAVAVPSMAATAETLGHGVAVGEAVIIAHALLVTALSFPLWLGPAKRWTGAARGDEGGRRLAAEQAGRIAATALLAVATLLMLAVLATNALRVVEYSRVFDDFNMALPGSTVAVIKFAEATRKLWFLFLPPGGLIVAFASWLTWKVNWRLGMVLSLMIALACLAYVVGVRLTLGRTMEQIMIRNGIPARTPWDTLGAAPSGETIRDRTPTGAERPAAVAESSVAQTASRFLAALRDKDIETLKSLSLGAERGWLSQEQSRQPGIGQMYSMSVRRLEKVVLEAHEEVYGDNPDLMTRIVETAVQGDWAAVRLPPPPRGSQDKYVFLIFLKTDAGWRFVAIDDAHKPLADELNRRASDLQELLAADDEQQKVGKVAAEFVAAWWDGDVRAAEALSLGATEGWLPEQAKDWPDGLRQYASLLVGLHRPMLARMSTEMPLRDPFQNKADATAALRQIAISESLAAVKLDAPHMSADPMLLFWKGASGWRFLGTGNGPTDLPPNEALAQYGGKIKAVVQSALGTIVRPASPTESVRGGPAEEPRKEPDAAD